MDHIRRSPGWDEGRDWPREMTLHENRADLERHARDFVDRTGFTFTVLDRGDDVVGCLYVYPADDGVHDARVLSWVRETEAEHDEALRRAIADWLTSGEWPFTRPLYEPLLSEATTAVTTTRSGSGSVSGVARVELLDDRFVIRNEGLRRLLTIVGSITVRYEAIASVEIGLDELPPWYTWRIGYNPGLGSRRAGIFWWRGGKWFMDVADPAHTVVVHLKEGAGYGSVAVAVDDAGALAAELRSRAGLPAS